ncbi:hypothetical protein ABC304_01450 [Microbacterium sp. 1P10UB]|uniref:hypothetical protein n=1 Tax=unclassified Microbacterium TaxID=2609290 RepID=UPI0039A28C7E
MTGLQRTRARVTGGALVALPLALVMGACSAPGEAEVAPTAVPTASPTAVAEVTPPPTTADELARAEFVDAGPSGVPSGANVVSGAIGDTPLRLEGACTGDRVSYALFTASTDGPRTELARGWMACDEPFSESVSIGDHRGVVQLSFTDADAISSGWIRLLAGPT